MPPTGLLIKGISCNDGPQNKGYFPLWETLYHVTNDSDNAILVSLNGPNEYLVVLSLNGVAKI